LDDKGNAEVRDYTNVASDKHGFPALFKDVRQSCRGDAVPVHMMP
jgi:hypothetical protein